MTYKAPKSETNLGWIIVGLLFLAGIASGIHQAL